MHPYVFIIQYIVEQAFQFANHLPFNILIQNLIYWIL